MFLAMFLSELFSSHLTNTIVNPGLGEITVVCGIPREVLKVLWHLVITDHWSQPKTTQLLKQLTKDFQKVKGIGGPPSFLQVGLIL